MHCEFCKIEINEPRGLIMLCDTCDSNMVIDYDYERDEIVYWDYFYNLDGAKYHVSSSKNWSITSLSKNNKNEDPDYDDILELNYFIDKPNTLEEFKLLFDSLLKLTLYK